MLSIKLKPLSLRVVTAFGNVAKIRCFTNLKHVDGVLEWDSTSSTTTCPEDKLMSLYNGIDTLPEKTWESLPISESEGGPVRLGVILYYTEAWKNGHNILRQSVDGYVEIPPAALTSKQRIKVMMDTVGKVHWETHTIGGSDPEYRANDGFPMSCIEFECTVESKDVTLQQLESEFTSGTQKNKIKHDDSLALWHKGFDTLVNEQKYTYSFPMIPRMDWANVYMGTRLLGTVSATFLADVPLQRVSDDFLLSLLIVALILNLGIKPTSDLNALVSELKKRKDGKEKQLWTNIAYTVITFISNSIPYVNDIRLGRDGVRLTVEAVTHCLETLSGDCEDLEWLVCAIHWAAKNRMSSSTATCKITINGQACQMSNDNIQYLLDGLTTLLKPTKMSLLLCIVASSPDHGQSHASGLIRYENGDAHIIDGIEPMMVPMDEAHARRNEEINRTKVSNVQMFSRDDVRFMMSMHHAQKSLAHDLHLVRLFDVPRGTEICVDENTKKIGVAYESLSTARWTHPPEEDSMPDGDYRLKYPVISLTSEMAKFEITIDYQKSEWPGTQPDARVHIPYSNPHTPDMFKFNHKAIMQIKIPSILSTAVVLGWE